jgi:hypothetical protein
LVVFGSVFGEIRVILSFLQTNFLSESGHGAESSYCPVDAGEKQPYDIGDKKQRNACSQIIFGLKVAGCVYNGVGRRSNDQAVGKVGCNGGGHRHKGLAWVDLSGVEEKKSKLTPTTIIKGIMEKKVILRKIALFSHCLFCFNLFKIFSFVAY